MRTSVSLSNYAYCWVSKTRDLVYFVSYSHPLQPSFFEILIHKKTRETSEHNCINIFPALNKVYT